MAVLFVVQALEDEADCGLAAPAPACREPPPPEPPSQIERFVDEWIREKLRVPFQTCTAQQLYRAFLHRHVDLRPRDLPTQRAFTIGALKWLRHAHDGRVRYKVVSLESQRGQRRACRCWLPVSDGPTAGATEGGWAAECVDAFELALTGQYTNPDAAGAAVLCAGEGLEH